MGAEPSGADAYDAEVVARYLAHRHGSASPNMVMEEPAVLAHLGDVFGAHVLDLGCGDGSFAEVLFARGASGYHGIDGSPAMIAGAHQRVSDPRARFEVSSIDDVDVARGSIDLVASRMALHHLRRLGPVLRAAHDALRPGGRVLFTVAHPVITSRVRVRSGPRTDWTVDDYFEPGERRRSWFGAEVTWFHRTVEQYVTALLDAGFSIGALCECEPDAELLGGDVEELARRRRVPVVLLLAGRRS